MSIDNTTVANKADANTMYCLTSVKSYVTPRVYTAARNDWMLVEANRPVEECIKMNKMLHDMLKRQANQ